MSKKETTKITKKNKESKSQNKKTDSFFTGVKKEMGKVRWPLKQEMIKYSLATLSFIVFFALFFVLGDLIVAGFKILVG